MNKPAPKKRATKAKVKKEEVVHIILQLLWAIADPISRMLRLYLPRPSQSPREVERAP